MEAFVPGILFSRVEDPLSVSARIFLPAGDIYSITGKQTGKIYEKKLSQLISKRDEIHLVSGFCGKRIREFLKVQG